MPALLVDLSHHNAIPNWPVLRTAVAGIIGKASEGTGFADPSFGQLRSGAESNALAFGAYHFTRLGDPAAEARWFVSCLGGRLRPGEFVGLDLEVTVAGVDPVAWTVRWLDAMAALGVPVRLLYLNKSELAAYQWAPIVARGVRLWLAAYDGLKTPIGSGSWPTLTLKQFTDAGTVPGEAGTVDVDVLFGALTDLTGGTDMTPADLLAATLVAADGKPYPLSAFIVQTNATSFAAARDAAIARHLAEQAATGAVLTKAQIDAIALQIEADLVAGVKVTVVPTTPAVP